MLLSNVNKRGTCQHGEISSFQEGQTASRFESVDAASIKTLCESQEGISLVEDAEDKVDVEWRFRVCASIGRNKSHLSTATDVIGSIAFDSTTNWFATGGIARKVRVYSLQSILDEANARGDGNTDEIQTDGGEEMQSERTQLTKIGDAVLDHDKWAGKIICTPARLSSIKWVPYSSNIIGCGDYDGVITEWDINTGVCVTELDEHGGRRIWSIDYSHHPPYFCASASDDGTVRLWARGSPDCVSRIVTPSGSSVCCAEFNPSCSHIMALASSDSRVYVFDIRHASSPILTLHHHRRPASYVRFLGRNKLVSAAVDSTIKLWDVSRTSSHLVRTFAAHHNTRNFVGLSVWKEGGLVACGSETNEAFAYDCRWMKPILRYSFQVEQASLEPGKSIVSAVCWRERSSDGTLVAANSDGFLRILSGHSKVLS